MYISREKRNLIQQVYHFRLYSFTLCVVIISINSNSFLIYTNDEGDPSEKGIQALPKLNADNSKLQGESKKI